MINCNEIQQRLEVRNIKTALQETNCLRSLQILTQPNTLVMYPMSRGTLSIVRLYVKLYETNSYTTVTAKPVFLNHKINRPLLFCHICIYTNIYIYIMAFTYIFTFHRKCALCSGCVSKENQEKDWDDFSQDNQATQIETGMGVFTGAAGALAWHCRSRGNSDSKSRASENGTGKMIYGGTDYAT